MLDEIDALPEQLGLETLNTVISLFDVVPDVLFWFKDRNLRIWRLNHSFADRVKLSKEEIIGKTDADLYFPELARVFMADDEQVMRTGKPIWRKVELLTNRWGGVEWRSTTKLPVRGQAGKIVGTTGISQPLTESPDRLPPEYRAFSHIIEYCRDNLAEGVDVEQMASHAGMSLATLTRRFRKHLQISPGEFLAQLRLSRACQLLGDSPLNVTEISLECGYESPAAFSRAFRRQMQLSPREYQQTQTHT
ncbi:AraC family transcriptional regulator [Cerasicoccus frondis]|uniref:AraC family transcriptional regulator n=1 Tax=Cerasicoccus frondis TaxID=490090 RepID=UPI00285278B6|nr:helix-turn-helix domain-containing protein [Cerasicoccus frondis]